MAILLNLVKSAIGVFIYLQKAYDTVSNDLLLKNRKCVIRGVVHKWLGSYFDKRMQFVSYDNVKSNLLISIRAVPQGSVIVPTLLFIKSIHK